VKGGAGIASMREKKKILTQDLYERRSRMLPGRERAKEARAHGSYPGMMGRERVWLHEVQKES